MTFLMQLAKSPFMAIEIKSIVSFRYSLMKPLNFAVEFV